ncbi:leucine-rich repeat and IQ domain-containing protein 3 [Polypterus senegalus]|uniref:leucine-rich repeat and IQ domain-containing protein 3 n=1 Tax=Polypterus senegalus TaxID=55291 RepID=UPI0019669FE5|nr:leucine-rich repeat and IQ domain-containing protein 3 [Polypterus senegalus]XP_039592088.1 leucine-rich repeat and IQ domain-containing protein 3 [Polypterus senegalus]XP_039592089.1 leucine-rich repeat and IQ domain-containing protein 3 [Polypterus senegalus]
MAQMHPTDFLVPCSKEILLRFGKNDNQKKEDNTELQSLVMVKINGLLLKNAQNIQYCTLLKICIMPNNYIKKMDPLMFCPHLVKIDLHGNQVSQLPESFFWENMKSLQILILHDNAIGKEQNTECLSKCPGLIALTLFDNPVSLRKNYRHSIVNTIWSLKALDNYVISDEEIIEDWTLPQKFRAQNKKLFIDLCPVSATESFSEEMKLIKEVTSKINYILAIYSPVIIIQRWIRGYLTRKRLKVLQRYSFHTSNKELPKREQGHEKRNCKSKTPGPHKQNAESDIYQLPSGAKRIILNVDLKKLLSEAPQALQDTKKSFKIQGKNKSLPVPFFSPEHNKLMKAAPKRHKDVLPPLRKGIADMRDQGEDKVGFRLSGFKTILHDANPVNDLRISRHENGKTVREAIDQLHFLSQDAVKSKTFYQPPVSMEKRLIAKMYGSISLAPFQVIEKAYKDREKAESQTIKSNWVSDIRANRNDIQSNIQGYAEAKKNVCLQMRQQDELHLQNAMQLQEESNKKMAELVQERYTRFLENKKRKTAEQDQVKNFSKHHLSLSKALLKHDTKSRQGLLHQKKTHLVLALKQEEEEQKEQFKKHMKYRQLALQAATVSERKMVDQLIKTNEDIHLTQAKMRVRALKANQVTIHVMEPVLVDQSPLLKH